MTLPTPEDPGRAPVWENYIVAQAVQAALGVIPQHALAMGVEVAGVDVRLRLQLSEVTEQDIADMEDIRSQLEALVGTHVHIELTHEVVEQRALSPHDHVRWIFLARD